MWRRPPRAASSRIHCGRVRRFGKTHGNQDEWYVAMCIVSCGTAGGVPLYCVRYLHHQPFAQGALRTSAIEGIGGLPHDHGV